MKLERFIENNFSDVCVWNEIFNEDDRTTLQEGFLLTGILSAMFSAWLSVTLLCSSLRFDRSYRNLANFTSVACVRRILPTLLHLPLVKCIDTLYEFQTFSCELFAFLETFLAVFEVECLTHVCIERYVLAKYITNGWQMRKNHYCLYFCLCVFFSCLYSLPPLFGIGRYGFDFQCTSCTLDMILPETWQRYFIVTIFLLRSVKPAVVISGEPRMVWFVMTRNCAITQLGLTRIYMRDAILCFLICADLTCCRAMMLVWARVLENKLPSSMKHHQYFTRSIMVIALVNLLCWIPIAIIRGSVLLSQLMYVDLLPMTPGYYVMWAMWIHWIAPAVTAIAMFLVDDRVRYKMFNLCAPEREIENNDNKTD